MSKQTENSSRKTITLPDIMWEQISEFRFKERISTEAEAFRRLIQTGLKTEKTKGIIE